MAYIISSGESSDGIILEKDSITVLDGGIVMTTTVNGDGEIEILNGGIANSTIVNAGGSMQVSSGGTTNSTTVNNGGTLNVYGTANNIMVNAQGHLCVQNGGIVNNLIIYSKGRMYISSGGITNNAMIGGAMEARGDMSNTAIYSGGYLYCADDRLKNTTVYAGATISCNQSTITGYLTILEGAIVSAYRGIIDFDISNRMPKTSALINNFSRLSARDSKYTLTVSDTQAIGDYTLASYVNFFEITITVQNTFGEELGTLYIDSSLSIGKIIYTLSLENDMLILIVDAPDMIAPTVSNIHASITTPTNHDIVLTADFSDDIELASSLYKLGEKGEWTAYVDGVIVSESTTVYFKAIDTTGNESDVVSYTVSNIDKVAPEAPITAADITTPTNGDVLVTAKFSEDSVVKEYSFDGENWGAYPGGVLLASNQMVYFRSIDAASNISEVAEYEVTNIVKDAPYIVEYSSDNFEHVLRFKVSSDALDSFRLSSGTYQSRTKMEDCTEWMVAEQPIVSRISNTPQLIKSDADGNADVFFANPVGTWESCYLAQHVGSINDWNGTNEYAALYGKNKIADIFEGSTDANILLMTDDNNGDALFVDDIYSDSPDELGLIQARIAQIDEIRAGAGDDIVDMTSQQFEYIGDGLTIRGGEGNDTIWANKGDNRLFGDAGNDRIVGASGDDVIVGGIGNDRMHGGGGDDVFTFCENWGVDNVEQLATGTVTLWFASGDEANWNAETLTYTDGKNSVKISGVAADRVTLKFGDDGSAQFASLTSMGAFFDATSERIFEESGKGILASL